VNRGAATRDETKDALETIAASAGNLQDATGCPAKGSQSGNESQEQRTVFLIERDVEENALRIYRSPRVHGEHSVDLGLLVLLRSLVGRPRGSIVRGWIAASIGYGRALLNITITGVMIIFPELFQDPMHDLPILTSDSESPRHLFRSGRSDNVFSHSKTVAGV